MKALARSVIEALLFLEMSGDDIVDPDSAVRAMENIAYELAKASEAERMALREALDEQIEAVLASGDAHSKEEVIKFYRSLPEGLGLDHNFL